MTQHDMTAQTVADSQGTFEVDVIAGVPVSQRGYSERLLHCIDGESILEDIGYGQADALNRYAIALVDLQGRVDPYLLDSRPTDRNDLAFFFNYSGKHDIICPPQ